MGLFADVTAPSVSGALTDVGTVVSGAIDMFAGQPILLAMLGCALAGVGLKLFKRAKSAVK